MIDQVDSRLRKQRIKGQRGGWAALGDVDANLSSVGGGRVRPDQFQDAEPAILRPG